jgi:hypothetical protein
MLRRSRRRSPNSGFEFSAKVIPDCIDRPRSLRLRAALGTELRARRQFGLAGGAGGGIGQLVAALGTEPGAVGFGLALRADELTLALDVQLLAAFRSFAGGHLGRSGGLTLGARGFDLDLGIGRAVEAQALRGIPAAVTDIAMALGAAMEMLLRLLDGFGELLVPGAAEAGLRESIDGRADAAGDTAQEARGLAQPAGGLAAAIGHEGRAPGIRTALAKEVELEAGIHAMRNAVVAEVLREFDLRHIPGPRVE